MLQISFKQWPAIALNYKRFGNIIKLSKFVEKVFI